MGRSCDLGGGGRGACYLVKTGLGRVELEHTRRPQAGRRMGRCRRPRGRSLHEPRGYDPTPPAVGPMLGRARLTPVGAVTP